MKELAEDECFQKMNIGKELLKKSQSRKRFPAKLVQRAVVAWRRPVAVDTGQAKTSILQRRVCRIQSAWARWDLRKHQD